MDFNISANSRKTAPRAINTTKQNKSCENNWEFILAPAHLLLMVKLIYLLARAARCGMQFRLAVSYKSGDVFCCACVAKIVDEESEWQ